MERRCKISYLHSVLRVFSNISCISVFQIRKKIPKNDEIVYTIYVKITKNYWFKYRFGFASDFDMVE